MSIREKLQQIPPAVTKGVVIVALSFILGLCYPLLKKSFSAERETSTPPRTTLPSSPEGIQTDAFSIALFQHVLNQVPEGNVVITPNSISHCLSELGRHADSEHREMFQKLQLQAAPTNSTLEIFESSFLFTNAADTLPSVAEQGIIHTADFSGNLVEAHQILNSYVYNGSGGLIPLMFNGSTAPRSSRLLASATVGYRTDWYYPIRPEQTNKEIFYNADGTKPRVHMMQANGRFRLAQDPAGKWKAAALFMRNAPQFDTGEADTCALIIIQPTDEFPLSARPLAESLTPQQYSNIRTALAQSQDHAATIKLPRFSFNNTRLDMFPSLHVMGLSSITRRNAAPFPQISSTQPFPLDGFYQQCTIQVEESPDHTPAAEIMGSQPHSWEFNRPFIWMLMPLTASGAPYAMGIIEYL